MPRKEDIDSIGAVLHLLGEKPLPDRISKEDYKSYKDIFTDDILSTIYSAKNVVPSIDELIARDTGGAAGATGAAPTGDTNAAAAPATEDPLAGLGDAAKIPAGEASIDDLLGGLDTSGITDIPDTPAADDVPAAADGTPAVDDITSLAQDAAETPAQDDLSTIAQDTDAPQTADAIPDLGISDTTADTDAAALPADEPAEVVPDPAPATDDIAALLAQDTALAEETPADGPAVDAAPDVPLEGISDIAAPADDAALPPLDTPTERTPPPMGDLGSLETPLTAAAVPTAGAPGDELPPAMRIRMYPRIKLSDDAMAAIVERINGLSPYFQAVTLDAVLYDKLEESDMQKLLDMLASGGSEEELSSFFHTTLGVLAPSAATGVPIGMPAMEGETTRARVPRFIPAITAFVENYLPSLRIIGIVAGGVIVVGIIVYALAVPWQTTMLIEEGLRLIDKVEYEKAERNFKKATEMQYFFAKPFLKNIPWYDRYANRYLGKGATEHAKKKLDTALAFEPKNMDIRLTYGVYYRREGELHQSETAFRFGEILYKHILSGYNRRRVERSIAAGDAAGSVKREYEFIATETWATNVKMLEPISKPKKLVSAYDGRGMLYIVWADTMSEGKEEKLENAIDNYRTMLTRTGDGVLPRKRFAQIYIRLDDRKYVDKQMNRIKAYDEEFIDDELSPELAEYLLNKKEYVKSRVLMENILKKYPANERALVTAADYWVRLKEYDKAEEILSNYALSLYGPTRTEGLNKRAFIHNTLGMINYNRGQYVSAIEQFSEALKVNGMYADAHYNLAQLYFYQNNNYDLAAYHYEMAARDTENIMSRKPLLNYNLGWINYYRGDAVGYENSYNAWYPVHQRMRGNPVAAYAVGNALLHMKDKENLAEGYYLEAKELLERLREKTGKLSMDRAIEFHIVNFLASLNNNMGVIHYRRAQKGIYPEENSDKAFRAFVQSAQYFDLVKTSRKEMMEERVVILGKLPEGDVGIPKLNIMRLTDIGKRKRRDAIIDDYIPKDLYYLGK